MNTKKNLIVGNWKMNKTIPEAVTFLKDLKYSIVNINTNELEIVVCPTFTALYSVNKEIRNSNIKLGAQNVYFAKNGAFTGEISAEMLKDVGCSYVIIGHSERRQYFKETNKNIGRKIKAVLELNLIPIICIGETEKENASNIAFDIIKKQILDSLKELKLSKDMASSIVLAYEPVWAIGTGKIATAEQIQKMHYFIRKICTQMSNLKDINIKIIYGGSVNSNNVVDFINKPDVDGILVGSASLEISSFLNIINKCTK
ncbi:MAG: triose-phosphate isomerase [Endomicrobium sp.]|jgi:triosephosphate isomerase|nr:triose-phosphate isomerase [Endomicrobium sp.]